MALWFIYTCDACGFSEERVFSDSYTGKRLCATCLHTIIGRLTMSPATEGDNLGELWEELTT